VKQRREMVRVRLNREFVELLLARRNISQNSLARSLGLSSGYLAQLMNGARYPSPRLRRRILEMLNPLSFDDLFIIEHPDAVREDEGRRGA
jgi:transcriptional regulator with XRE-family HTH domain